MSPAAPSRAAKRAAAEDAFFDFLRRCEHGRVLDKLDDARVNLIRALWEAFESGNASAKAVLDIKITMMLGDGGAMRASVAITTKKPGPLAKASTMFVARDGAIIGSAPTQSDMFARDEDDDEGEDDAQPTGAVGIPAASSGPAVAVAAPSAAVAVPPVTVEAVPVAPVPQATGTPVADFAASHTGPHSHLRALP